MPAVAGAEVSPDRALGAPALLAIVVGAGDHEQAVERLTFYAEVMEIRPSGISGGANVLDLGPGGAESEALATLVMQAFGQLPATRVRRRLASLRVVAASRVRAAAAAERVLRAGSGEVTVMSRDQVHAGFFGLEVLGLRHRRFDGGTSEGLLREVFISGDAVTVLPYDPRRDRVLLVEQFRTGPLGRGDAFPWQLEAIAGRIDPGEAPQDAARREAVEEAGLVLGELESVAEYYPSPGAMTEYIYSYVALCDLPDGVAGVFGAADEAEDIKGHLLGFDALMAAVASGEVANAPMILTALWLQRERGRLRAGVA
jgi:nudix-type nucleoside diphosphatase (YffH/AdpP family)